LTFGASEDFWLNLQALWDIYCFKKAEAKELENIKPLAS
jgi:plasmid maintenance system antidote protein VapI